MSQDEDDSYILAEEVYIKLYNSQCIRNCSAYNIIIFGDGTVEYEGIRSVSKMGKFTKHISKNKVVN